MVDPGRNEAVEAGYRLRGGRVIEQALATKTIALVDMDAFKSRGFLGDSDILELDARIERVRQGMNDRNLAASETRSQTADQVSTLRVLKVDRRCLDHCVDRVFHKRPEILQYRQHSYRGSSVASTCEDVNARLTFARAHQAQLAPVGVTAVFLAKLEDEVRTLQETSGTHDAAIRQLPETTRAYCEVKGRLYYAIKDINSAGHALHADDLVAAAKYSLKELYRKRSKGEPASPTPPAPGPASPK